MKKKQINKYQIYIGSHWILRYLCCLNFVKTTMKKHYYLVFLSGIFGLSSLKAQEKSNLLKLNLWPLVVSNVSLEYERSIGERISLNGTLSLRPKAALPFESIWESAFDDVNNILDQAKLGAFSITPELRFYIGNRGILNGFYIAPFVKYSNYNLTTEISVNETNYQKVVPISGSLDAFTGGIAIGNQWHLGKDIYLDWRIIGPNYGFNNGNFQGKATLNVDEQREIKKQLDDFDSSLMHLRKEVNADGVTITSSGAFAGVRTALSIGYRF